MSDKEKIEAQIKKERDEKYDEYKRSEKGQREKLYTASIGSYFIISCTLYKKVRTNI